MLAYGIFGVELYVMITNIVIYTELFLRYYRMGKIINGFPKHAK